MKADRQEKVLETLDEIVELEEYARGMIRAEQLHVAEIRKMLRSR